MDEYSRFGSKILEEKRSIQGVLAYFLGPARYKEKQEVERMGALRRIYSLCGVIVSASVVSLRSWDRGVGRLEVRR